MSFIEDAGELFLHGLVIIAEVLNTPEITLFIENLYDLIKEKGVERGMKGLSPEDRQKYIDIYETFVEKLGVRPTIEMQEDLKKLEENYNGDKESIYENLNSIVEKHIGSYEDFCNNLM